MSNAAARIIIEALGMLSNDINVICNEGGLGKYREEDYACVAKQIPLNECVVKKDTAQRAIKYLKAKLLIDRECMEPEEIDELENTIRELEDAKI